MAWWCPANPLLEEYHPNFLLEILHIVSPWNLSAFFCWLFLTIPLLGNGRVRKWELQAPWWPWMMKMMTRQWIEWGVPILFRQEPPDSLVTLVSFAETAISQAKRFQSPHFSRFMPSFITCQDEAEFRSLWGRKTIRCLGWILAIPINVYPLVIKHKYGKVHHFKRENPLFL